MVEIPKIPVEKVLEKLRRDDAKSVEPLREQNADALSEKLKELKRQRLRLDWQYWQLPKRD